ncbi:uncharacterized protein A4U43_C01F26950 [Asparagus officinalis]|uniref:Uncharacterized protein n=1 Tax=Asparagus officinalis TaxID=4686 RepID=A0A5P1FUZ8_ASPOF|nr:uncharacterized protein A4U43_C01F26950 [Asparagus officinalis]
MMGMEEEERIVETGRIRNHDLPNQVVGGRSSVEGGAATGELLKSEKQRREEEDAAAARRRKRKRSSGRRRGGRERRGGGGGGGGGKTKERNGRETRVVGSVGDFRGFVRVYGSGFLIS